ncbi:MAG: FAD-dependent oxidoreductase [Gemmatimonadota bacterium]|nr:FAD-dependent oxidoreductase [Gemmatimonadota bacterium]
MTGRTTVILGGGVGGVVAARRLRARLPRTDRVVLVDRSERHLFQPSLLWLATGTRRAERIQRPLAAMVGRGVELVLGEIEAIDPALRATRVAGQEIAADALIIALGADLAPELVPGLAEGGHNLYTLAGAQAIEQVLGRIESGRVVVLTAAPAYKCPAAPYEAAMLVEALLAARGVRGAVELSLYAAEPGPMGVAGPVVSAGVRQMVESRGIGYFPEHQVARVDPAGRTLHFANGATAGYDLLIYVPPHRAPAAVRAAGLTNAAGWVPVHRGTLATEFPGVFAIGDVTTISLAMGKPLPKAGVFAHRQAEVVADNLVAAWTGHGSPRAFEGHGECFLETGFGRAGFGAGNFYGEPLPQVALRSPNRWWHWGKVLFEWRWLRGW